LADLKGYAVFKGTAADLSEEMKSEISKRRDLATFSFLFAKKVEDERCVIHGKAYSISTEQEILLDAWERYPRWYQKEDVTIADEQGSRHSAVVYVINRDGVRLDSFERIQGDLQSYIESAKLLRKKKVGQ
jgi:gamma-glutamylcyclotransferase (GGCT)/AIG2-like uncharacterized protein YtfP